MTQLIFWTAAIGVVYSYLIYPIVLLLLRAFHRPSKEIPTERTPKVTLIITAYNESSNISEKLDNSVESTYPMDELQIIVASDASDDGTDSIVLNRPEKNIELIRSPDRRGKEHAQGLAVRAAKGEILVFSDAGTRLDSDAIMQMVRQFDNPTVGAVSSEDKFISETGQIVGEGAYVRYEMALRRLESEVNSIVGLSGSFFAARRDVCENWREDIPSDFNIAMNAVRLGYRAVSAKNIHGYYRDIKDSGKEFSRKVRTVIRGLTAFFARIEILAFRPSATSSRHIKSFHDFIRFFPINFSATNSADGWCPGRSWFVSLRICFCFPLIPSTRRHLSRNLPCMPAPSSGTLHHAAGPMHRYLSAISLFW